MARVIRILSFFALFVIGASLVFAEVHVCGTDGVDNSCTVTSFKSLLSAAAPGDSIRIANGTHDWQTNGATTQPILDKEITVYGSGQYEVDGSHNDIGTWPVTLNVNVNESPGINHAAF